MNNKLIIFSVAALAAGFLGGYLVTPKADSFGWRNQQANRFDDDFQRGNGMANDEERPRMGNDNSMGGTGNRGINRGNCLSDECLLVSDLDFPAGELPQTAIEALKTAIDDEYKALATYEAVIAKFGAVRPFSMIKGAEEQHIATLKAVFDKYGVEIPVNTWADQVTASDTLQEACQTGVEAEIANAKLYKNELLPVVKDYADLTQVFENLMRASETKHLTAFERCN